MSSKTEKNTSIESLKDNPKDIHLVGWITTAHGIKGEVFVKLKAKVADWLDNVDRLALRKKVLSGDPDKTLTWCEIVNAKPHKEGLIVKLSNIQNRNEAESWLKAEVFIPSEALVAESGEAIFLKQIEGFELYEVDAENLESFGKKVGVVVDFASNGPQDLLVVKTESGLKALVPFVDAYILRIDFDNQRLLMDLPQGLIDQDSE